MNNPFKQASPRLSLSYSLSPEWFINANAGRYYQLPSYTTMGYADEQGDLVKTNKTGCNISGQTTTWPVWNIAPVAGQKSRWKDSTKRTTITQFPYWIASCLPTKVPITWR